MEFINTHSGAEERNETNTSLLHHNGLNETTEHFKNIKEINDALKPIIDNLLLLVLIVVMLSMGCEITWKELKAHLMRPIGIGIGMVSQFFIMPLAAYSILRLTHVDGLYATGLLIISCCPGGVLSNAFSYFADGDLSLSVAMTTTSTLMAMGMMPLNLMIYGPSFETQDLSLPYGNLALSLVFISMPVLVGMLLRWKFPKGAHYITKVGTGLGIFIVIACITLEVIIFPDMFTDVPGKIYGIILPMPFIGFSLGFVLALAFKQNMAIRKTVALECGIQNVVTALAIISLSFEIEHQTYLILLPWLYGFSMISSSTIICILYQIYKRYAAQDEKNDLKGFDLVATAEKKEDNCSGLSL